MYIHRVSRPNRNRHVAGIAMMSSRFLLSRLGVARLDVRGDERANELQTMRHQTEFVCSLPSLCILYPRLQRIQQPHLLGQCGTCPRSEDFKWIDVLTLSSDTAWEFPPISSVPTYFPTVSKTLRADCCEACFEIDWFMTVRNAGSWRRSARNGDKQGGVAG